MDWGLSGLVILSNILIGKKNKWGWIISAVSSVLWIFYAAFAIKQYGLIPASLVLLVIAIVSAEKWFKEDRKRL